MNSKIENRNKSCTQKVKRSIDMWVLGQGLAVDTKKHDELAEFITKRVSHLLQIPSLGHQSILLDHDLETGGYKNPRITDAYWSCAEEALFPEDPKTGEPVETAIADFVWPLPDIECVPEI